MLPNSAFFPFKTIPSESTIEVTTNHCLLTEINKPPAWIYVPTRNDELNLGYDASMQNTKLLIIQYKRLKCPRKSYRINIDRQQHITLTKKFPSGTKLSYIKPYVFYAFSTCKNYEEIDSSFKKGRPDKLNYRDFLKKCVFFDAHDVVPGCVTIIPNLDDEKVSMYGYPHKKIKSFNGLDFVQQAKECSIGNSFGNLLYLYAKANNIDDIGSFGTEPLIVRNFPRVNFLTMPLN